MQLTFKLSIAASPEKVFQAITTAEGFAGWWSPTTEIDPRAGKKFVISFHKREKTERMVFTVTEADENKILTLVCTENNVFDTWIGTELRFRLTAKGLKTELLFTHASSRTGWKASPEFEPTRNGWEFFMGSLKRYCETGKGEPWEG